jgi:hypothetical protein
MQTHLTFFARFLQKIGYEGQAPNLEAAAMISDIDGNRRRLKYPGKAPITEKSRKTGKKQ